MPLVNHNALEAGAGDTDAQPPLAVNHLSNVQGGSKVHFRLVILAICSSLFLGSLELTGLSTSLPTVTHDIPGFPSKDFIWVGSAYALAAAAFLPLSSSCAQTFGRKPIVIFCVILFGAGSALCGAARSAGVFLTGRTVQGLGGGGIISLTNIILADLVPLRQRGIYSALTGIVWSVTAAIGPVIGGVLAQSGAWRWFFYLNLPICGLVIVLNVAFLQLKTPLSSFSEKITQFDWIGIFLIMASSVSCMLALTWAGSTYSWKSVQVLVPLFLGVTGFAICIWYEWFIAKQPFVSPQLLSNRTSLSGYVQTFVVQAVLVSFIYYIPIYFQACKDASPRGSAVEMLGLALAMPPISILGGMSVTILKRYRPQLWLGWSVTVLGMGLLSTLEANTPRVKHIIFEILAGGGLGVVYTATFFPILAPLPVEYNAQAITLGIFLRTFAQVWGITICGAIIQNGLKTKLPVEFRGSFGSDQLTYSAVSQVQGLPQPLKSQVQAAFASSVQVMWWALAGLSGVGLVASLAMKDHPLRTKVDQNWGMKDRSDDPQAEKKSKQQQPRPQPMRTPSLPIVINYRAGTV